MNTAGFAYETGNMPLVDFITLAGTRNNENRAYKGGEEEFQAINWPQVMTHLLEKLMGYKEVSSNGCYNPVKNLAYFNDTLVNKIEEMNEAIKNGYKLVWMIDSDLIADNPDFHKPEKVSYDEIKKSVQSVFAFEYHWVTLEGTIDIKSRLDYIEGKILKKKKATIETVAKPFHIKDQSIPS